MQGQIRSGRGMGCQDMSHDEEETLLFYLLCSRELYFEEVSFVFIDFASAWTILCKSV